MRRMRTMKKAAERKKMMTKKEGRLVGGDIA